MTMKPSRTHPLPARGFSLIELMVAVGLLGVIVLALYAMFDQTQKALRGASGQADVMEGARAALGLVTRDIEEAGAAGVPNGPNFLTHVSAKANLIENQTLLFQEHQPVLQDVFGIKNVGDHRWQVFGYFIASEDSAVVAVKPPVGTLYRYEDRDYRSMVNGDLRTSSSNTPIQFVTRGSLGSSVLQRNLITKPGALGSDPTHRLNNSARVLDGVVNFRVTAYDTIGRPIDLVYPTNSLPAPDGATRYPPLTRTRILKGLVTDVIYADTAMPAYVEVELDTLEPRLLEQFRALPPDIKIRNRYLTNHLGQIQSFRQRIPIRSSFR